MVAFRKRPRKTRKSRGLHKMAHLACKGNQRPLHEEGVPTPYIGAVILRIGIIGARLYSVNTTARGSLSKNASK